ncbi:hypothetical protein UFO1_2970 [Pelosinus sp. UFO1]|nr:hypothetical protein UFO1_2970 [Pelosinus sp. UFO1]
MLSEQAWIALILFVICYAVIISKKFTGQKLLL